MTFTLILAATLLLLWALAFFTRRRFGVLALALVAGDMLSRMWVGDLTPLVANAGFVMIKPPLMSVVSLVLVLAPALLLLFSGPAAHKKFDRWFGSVVFAVLAVSLMFDSLVAALVIDDFGQIVHDQFLIYRPIVITACILLALLDVLAIHTRKNEPKKK